MAGWSKKKRYQVEKAFYAYLDECYVDSRDYGRISLGEHLFDGQRRFITEVFDGLELDIHKFYVLKSRQLGISTICRALLIFFIGIFRGVRGALVFDTASNREEARVELTSMIKNLPPKLQFPKVSGTGYGNREAIQLVNGSRVLFRNAGVQKKKTSGTLGRSVGLSLAHLSEICSYDNDEGLIAFENSLSDANPDRLYIYESTARGYNIWNKIWEKARHDPSHCKCIFLGWWSKETQIIDYDEPDFKLYGQAPPSDDEKKKIDEVKRLYNHDITQAQLAWIRRRMDPAAQQVADDTDTEEDDPTLIQEQPWTEDDSWQLTGSRFFPNTSLHKQTNEYVSSKYKSYSCVCGDEFVRTKIIPAENYKQTDLKVWEDPLPGGVYCIACDPAYGENEHNNRSSIQVGRCFADGIDQVAEYASPLINTRQLAWMIAALLGWYGDGADAYYILELNGPGVAVFNELKGLRHQIDNAYFGAQMHERGLQNIFRNVRTYIYTRPDGLAAGQNLHFKTTASLKVTIMEQLRGYVMSGIMRLRSMASINEMKAISREGDNIGAPSGGRDDCVVALALLAYYWETVIRKQLVSFKRTREAEEARLRRSVVDQVRLFQQNQLSSFFERKARQRSQMSLALAKNNWRYGPMRRW